MKLVRVISLLFAGLVLFLACNRAVIQNRSSARDTVTPFECGERYELKEMHKMGCKSDDDCAVIDADCCGCSASGKRGAILAQSYTDAIACLKKSCAGVLCAQSMSTDKSCKLRDAKCNTGLCELK